MAARAQTILNGGPGLDDIYGGSGTNFIYGNGANMSLQGGTAAIITSSPMPAASIPWPAFRSKRLQQRPYGYYSNGSEHRRQPATALSTPVEPVQARWTPPTAAFGIRRFRFGRPSGRKHGWTPVAVYANWAAERQELTATDGYTGDHWAYDAVYEVLDDGTHSVQ